MDFKKWEQPIFSVLIRSVGCWYDVRVNDIPVNRHRELGNVTLDVPASTSVFTGDNVLTAVVESDEPEEGKFNADARCEVSLCIRELEGDPRQREMVDGIVFRAADIEPEGGSGVESSPNMDGEHTPEAERLDETTVRVTRVIPLETPFAPWAWLSAPPVGEEDQAKAQLIIACRKFHSVLAEKNADAVTELTRTKAHEFGIAYYGDDEEGHEFIEFRQKMSDPDLELWPFEDDELTLEVLADGRMARLLTYRGTGPIIYKVKDQPIASYMNTVYCRDKKGQWMQIR